MERYFKIIDKSYSQGTCSSSSNSHSNLLQKDNSTGPSAPTTLSLELDSSDDNSDIGSAKKAQKRKLSAYCKSWELDKTLEPWLMQDEKKNAFCKFCNCELKAKGGVGDLYKHAEWNKHIQAANALNLQSDITKAFGNTQISNHKRQVAMAEIQLSAFCAEDNVSFLTMDHMIPMLQAALPDSTIGKDMKCAKRKTTSIVKNVIGETQLNELIGLMKIQPFSICIDESTDIGTVKLLIIVVRTELSGQIKDFFFALIKVENCNAESTFPKIIELFRERDICYNNFLIGFAADGANVMTGAKNSVASLFRKECPNLVIFKCVCHSFALCANYACSLLPTFVEGTTRAIYNFIQNSPKRVNLFKDLQTVLDYKPVKMLHPSQTMWLSLEATVNQILSRLEVLKLFFLHEDLEKFEATEKLINSLLNPLFEIYLKFLKFILTDVNKLNRLFQSESPQIHRLRLEVKNLYMKILEYFVKDEYIEQVALQKISIHNVGVLKNKNELYFGADSVNSLHILNDAQEAEFRENCQKFYIELCNQLLKRFDFENELLLAINSIAPDSVMNRTINLIVHMHHVPELSSYKRKPRDR